MTANEQVEFILFISREHTLEIEGVKSLVDKNFSDFDQSTHKEIREFIEEKCIPHSVWPEI